MNVLLIGHAAENEATARLLRRSKQNINHIYSFGSQSAEDMVSRPLPVPPHATVSQVIKGATKHRIQLVILTTEQAILSGIGNALQSVRIPCFGPTTVAAHFRWDQEFEADLAGAIGIKTMTRTFHRNLKALTDGLHERFSNEGVTVRAVRADGRTRIFHCASLTQIANAVYVLETQPDLDQYSAFYLEPYATGTRCTFTTMVNGRNLVSIGPASAIKSQIMDRLIRPLLTKLTDAGAPYTGWLSAELMIVEQDFYLCELRCLPRPDFLSDLSHKDGFDFLENITSVLATDTEQLRPLMTSGTRPLIPPPPVRIPLPPR